MQDQTMLVSQEDLEHVMEEKNPKKQTYKINDWKKWPWRDCYLSGTVKFNLEARI